MTEEREYLQAFDLARKAKKRYLKKALEKEEKEHLISIGLDGWDEKEREDAYQKEVLPYWDKYGIAPEKFWFELFGSRDHQMNPRFIPADIYFTELIPYLNNGLQAPGLSNKAYFEYLFCDVKQPKTVAIRIEGSFYDEKRNPIDEDKMLALCREHSGRLFLKISTGSSNGRGISVLTPTECSDEDIRKLFLRNGSNFIIQEEIRQHGALNTINPTSVCTIRVLSLLMDGKVYVESAGLRVGAPGADYVSSGDGGYYTEILEGGKLHTKVYNNLGKWRDHKGLFDENICIPSMDRVYDEVKRIHPRIGHFRCIGWDFTIDVNGEPVMIEYNVFPMLGNPQLVRCKPVFNEQTDWILEDYYEHRTWANNHRQDILIQ